MLYYACRQEFVGVMVNNLQHQQNSDSNIYSHDRHTPQTCDIHGFMYIEAFGSKLFTFSLTCRVQEFSPPSQAVLEVPALPICPSIEVLVAIEAVLNPTNDIQAFVEQICVTEKLMVSLC